MMFYHSLTSALIHTMAKQELKALNWPQLRLEYTLNWCQGDGVIFTGDISYRELLRIILGLRARRLLSCSEARELHTATREYGVTVQVRHDGSWYTHSGCARMSVEGLPDSLEGLEDILLKALREQYESLCGRVKTLGYQLIEGTLPIEYDEILFTRHTENTTLEAVAIDPAEFGNDDTEGEILEEYIRLILREKARVVSIRFQVKCAGELVASSWASGIVIRPGQPVRAWCDRYEIRYVTREARQAIAEKVQALRSFMKAA